MATVYAPRGRAYYAEGATFLVGEDRLIRNLTPDEAAALIRQGCRPAAEPVDAEPPPPEAA